MKSKTLKFDECVVARHKIEEHQIVVINDIPVSGELISHLKISLDFDKPDKVAYQLLSFPIDSILAHLDAYPDQPIEQDHVWPIITMKRMAEMAMLFARLEAKCPVEIEEL